MTDLPADSLQLAQRERPVLDHVSVGITYIDRSRRFYDAALRPLGLVRIVDFVNDRGSDYGAAHQARNRSFFLAVGDPRCSLTLFGARELGSRDARLVIIIRHRAPVRKRPVFHLNADPTAGRSVIRSRM